MMTRKFNVLTVFLWLFFLWLCFSPRAFSQPVPAKPKLLFLYLQNTSGFDREKLDEAFYKVVTDGFAKQGYELQPLDKFKSLLKEKKLSALLDYITLLDAPIVGKLGKLAKADKVIYGELTSYDEDFRKDKAKVWVQAQFSVVDAQKLELERSFELHVATELEGKKKGDDARKQTYDEFFKQCLLRFENRTEESGQEEEYIGNVKSGLFHSKSFNHLPKPEDQVILHSLKEAEEKGFKPCPICYPALHASTEAADSLELQLGQEIAGIVEHYYRVYHDEKLEAWVDKVGQKLVAQTPRRNLRYIFTILNTDEVNAFATAAGYVYVTKGLLDVMESEDELAGVLSHEVAHIVRKHAVTQYKRAANISLIGAVGVVLSGGGTAADLLSDFSQSLIMNGYDRKYEREADQLALVYLLKANYDPQDFLKVLVKLQDLEKSEPSKIQVYFSSHPATSERIKRAEEFLKNRSELAAQLDDILKTMP